MTKPKTPTGPLKGNALNLQLSESGKQGNIKGSQTARTKKLLEQPVQLNWRKPA